MVDTTLKTYATRQLACLALAGLTTFTLIIIGDGEARTTAPLPSAGGGKLSSGPQRAAIAGEAGIVDGDTLQIGQIRVRLEGIDAPEAGQTCLTRMGTAWNCGAQASHVLAGLIGRRQVLCEDLGLDIYGRTLATCYVGPLNINAEMVRLGYAWAFVRYSRAYVAQEAEARKAHSGIWDGQAIPAWDHRANRWHSAESASPSGCAIKGNVTVNGRIYHMPWSPWYEKIKMDGRPSKRWFCTEAEAIQAGWRPAQSF